MHVPTRIVGIMALKPVSAVLRQVSAEADWPEATLQRVAGELSALGLCTSRELRLGFPTDEPKLREEARGLGGEIAAKLNLDSAALGVLIFDAVCSTKGLSVSTCNSALARGEFKGSKRLLSGVYVDAEEPRPATTSTSSVVAPGMVSGPSCPLSPTYSLPILSLPRGRLSFGVSCPPNSSSSAGATLSQVARSLSSGDAKRPRIPKSGLATIEAKDDLKLARARREVLSLLHRVGSDSAVYCEIFGEGPRDLDQSEQMMLFGVLMARIQPKAIMDYCKEVNLYIDWLNGIKFPLTRVGPLMLCSYLHMTLSRGKSIPVKVRCALVWFESHAKIHMNACGVEVRDYVAGLTVRDPVTNQLTKVAHQAPFLTK